MTYSDAPPPTKFPIVPVVLTLVALLGVLAVLGGIKGFHAMQQSSAAAITVGNSFVDNMGAHNYKAARLLMTPGAQAKSPVSTMQDIETIVEKHHGAFVNHGQPQWNIQTFNGQTSVRLAYPAQVTKSTSTVSVILMQTDTGYRVNDVHYEF